MGATGAVMAAVNDALAPFGVVLDRQPLSPGRVAKLLAGRTPGGARQPIDEASVDAPEDRVGSGPLGGDRQHGSGG